MDKEAVRRKVFGDHVRRYRVLRGWQLDDLANRLGTTRASMSRIELGQQNLGIDSMISISQALEVPLRLLVDDVEAPGGSLGPLVPVRSVFRCV